MKIYMLCSTIGMTSSMMAATATTDKEQAERLAKRFGLRIVETDPDLMDKEFWTIGMTANGDFKVVTSGFPARNEVWDIREAEEGIVTDSHLFDEPAKFVKVFADSEAEAIEEAMKRIEANR